MGKQIESVSLFEWFEIACSATQRAFNLLSDQFFFFHWRKAFVSDV